MSAVALPYSGSRTFTESSQPDLHVVGAIEESSHKTYEVHFVAFHRKTTTSRESAWIQVCKYKTLNEARSVATKVRNLVGVTDLDSASKAWLATWGIDQVLLYSGL